MKNCVYIIPYKRLDQYEVLPFWKRWLRCVGFKFEPRMVVAPTPYSGVLITHPGNVFKLKAYVESLGYSAIVLKEKDYK